MRRSAIFVTTALVANAASSQEAPVELPTLFLDSALRDERALQDTPVAASVRQGEALERQQADTFEELIGDIPGVSIEGGPRAIAQEPNIRGFQDEQIVLRFDGARFNFNQAHRGRFFVDPDIVERVEVVRGGGSTLFGSGAIGGVISVDTKDAQDLLGPGQTVGARLRTGVSTNGLVFSNSATVYADWGQIDALAFLGSRNFSEDLESGDGVDIRNSRLDVLNGLVKFGYEPTNEHRLEFAFSQYDDDGTTPANSSSASTADDVDRDARVQTVRLSWDYAPEGSNLIDLSAILYANFLKITEDRFSDGRADQSNYDTIGFELVNRSRFGELMPVDMVYGFEVLRDTQDGLRDGAPRAQFPDAEATTIGVFAEATIAVSDQLDVIAGVRYDNYERDVDNPAFADAEDDFFSPRVGFSYRPNQSWQIFGNVARAFRAPTLTELYNDGVHFSSPGFPLGPGQFFSGVNNFVPNPNLREERSTQIEFGARFEETGVWQAGDSLSFSANAYYADVEDFIDQVVTFIDFTTGTPGPGGVVFNGTTTTRNIDAEIWGFEAELDYDAGSWFASAALSLPRGSAAGGEELGSIPQDRLVTTVGLRPNSAWTYGARLTLAGEQNDVPDGATPGEAYQLLDVFATWVPQEGPLEDVVFHIGVDNLFDENYQIFPNGLSQPGRTFKISTAITF
ncbi:MAG: TonB-dependent hemoglobin/transferrin/lactoferrin family receptor [Pseudomonadota bacterium]